MSPIVGTQSPSPGQFEALSEAKRLCRTLSSAPEPYRQAQTLSATLLRTAGWTPQEEALIQGFAHWLAARPSPAALKGRAQELLRALGA